MPSETYELIARAMAGRQQVLCLYQGHPRAICPAILGHTKGRERTLAYQFAGQSSTGLPAGGEWKCFQVSEMRNVELRDGEWHGGAQHSVRQRCVEVVDLDVNPESPYRPRRVLGAPARRQTSKRQDRRSP